MAFKIKREPAPAPIDIMAGTDNIVATQSWVNDIFKKFTMALANSIQTVVMKVTGKIDAAEIDAKSIIAENIQTSGIQLLDENGKPMRLSVVDGKLDISYDFEPVYLIPSAGVKVYQFQYDDSKTIYENFKDLDADSLKSRFLPFMDSKRLVVDGITCYMVCLSDGEDDYIGRTLLFSCDETRKMTRIKICDKEKELIRSIDFSEPCSQLTINLPQILDGADYQKIDIPERVKPSCSCSHGFPPPFMPPCHHPIISNIPLDPGIFDDDPPAKCDCCSRDSESSSAPIVCARDAKDEIIFEEYSTETYTNIVLKRNDFNVNELQFIIVETERV